MAVKTINMTERASGWQPFAKLNLLRNPFGELVREDRMAAAVIDLAALEPFLNRPSVALQFWGECGHGKTTHLLALHHHLENSHYVYLAEDERCPPIPNTAETGRTLIIDEAQRLPFWIRRRVFRSGGPLILGTHKDYRRRLQQHGYNVHGIAFENQLDAERLQTILNRRIELARFRAGKLPLISLQECQTLCERFGDNIRAVEAILFEAFQTLCEQDLETNQISISKMAILN